MVILGTLILDNLVLTLIHHNFGGCFSNGTWPRIVKTQEREREIYTYIHRSVYIYMYIYIYICIIISCCSTIIRVRPKDYPLRQLYTISHHTGSSEIHQLKSAGMGYVTC